MRLADVARIDQQAACCSSVPKGPHRHAIVVKSFVESKGPERVCPEGYKVDFSACGMMHRPYIMDLGSTNGTYLNGKRIEPNRYYGGYYSRFS